MILRNSYDFPARCRLCDVGHLPTIDTERSYDSDDFGGILYICSVCVGEMARMLGYTHPEKVADLEDELERTCERLDSQETENADLAAENATLKEAMNLAAPTAPAVKRGPGRPRKDA